MPGVETSLEGSSLVVTINRPEALNATNDEVRRGLADAWVQARDPGVRTVILTGAGDRAFCVGNDLKETAARNASDEPRRDSFWDQADPTRPPLDFWKPVIAAVNGYAIGGGCQLAMQSDIRIASENAIFGLSEVKWGRVGGTSLLPRLVPISIALELILTGRHIDAAEAYRIGLVNYVVPREQLLGKALDLAAEIGKNGPLAVMASKEAFYRGLNVPLQEAMRIERLEARAAQETTDGHEGPRAFTEKRKPEFQGH